jgi:chromosome segregation ATPase
MNDDINERLDDISKKLDDLIRDNSLAHQGLKSMIQEVQKTQGERFDKIDEQLKRISHTFCGPALEFFKDSKEDIEHIAKHIGSKLPSDLGKSLAKVHASIREK